MAHKWADWVHNPHLSGSCQRFKAGDQITIGPRVGGIATKPLQSGGGGGVPDNSKGGTKSEVAHKWAHWLHHLCHPGGGGGQRFKAGDRSKNCPQVGGLATETLPCGGSPTIKNGGQCQEWPISGWIGNITLAIWGVLRASKRGTISRTAHKWADWLHNSCHLGGPQCLKEGDNIGCGQQAGALAT